MNLVEELIVIALVFVVVHSIVLTISLTVMFLILYYEDYNIALETIEKLRLRAVKERESIKLLLIVPGILMAYYIAMLYIKWWGFNHGKQK